MRYLLNKFDLEIDLLTCWYDKNSVNIFLGKLHQRVPNYSAFSLKGTNVAKRSIECMKLSKPFNVGYSVTLRSKSMTEAKTRAFHVIF